MSAITLANVQYETINDIEVKIIKKNYIKSWKEFLLDKISDYTRGLLTTFTIGLNYRGINAFHDFLQSSYNSIPKGRVKILEISVFAPSKTQVCTRVIAIGNSVVLKELRKIPRAENVDPTYFERNNVPQIEGGRAFNSVLEAIGMGVLSANHTIHQPFINNMIKVLTVPSINEINPLSIMEKAVISFTHTMLQKIEASINEDIRLDLGHYSLKIFLNGFYPQLTNSLDEIFIKELYQVIEEVSDLAFTAIINPYSDLQVLRETTMEKLNPYIKVLIQEDQTLYFGKKYVEETSEEILKEVIISLIFAGADNVRKYLEHVMIEFGNDAIRNKYLQDDLKPYEYNLKNKIAEVGRLFTTIYAQPGFAMEDFTIEYKNERFDVRKGDQLHYTTWVANVDESEWGDNAKEFNPEKHQELYTRLNPLSTFGSGSRICRGKSLTLSIIEYFMTKLLQEYRWEAFVNGKKNHHPTKFGFNNSVDGDIVYKFRKIET